MSRLAQRAREEALWHGVCFSVFEFLNFERNHNYERKL